MSPTLQQFALSYHDYGFTIIPVAARGKKPVPMNWPSLRLTRADVVDNWSRNADYNIGLITGATGFVALDCDGPDHLAWALEHIPATPLRTISGSGSGGHLIYRSPVGVPVAVKRKLYTGLGDRPGEHAGLDFYGDGVQVVLPGSVHPTGGVYAWHDRPLSAPLPPIESVPVFDLAWLPVPPPPPPRPPQPDRPAPALGANSLGHGDHSTLDIVGLFQDEGLYIKNLGAGKHSVVCPWSNEHSEAPRGGADTSTAIWESDGERWPSFHCLHSHCAGRGITEVIAFFGPDRADRFCAEAWRPTRVTSPASPRLDDAADGLSLEQRWAAETWGALTGEPPAPLDELQTEDAARWFGQQARQRKVVADARNLVPVDLRASFEAGARLDDGVRCQHGLDQAAVKRLQRHLDRLAAPPPGKAVPSLNVSIPWMLRRTDIGTQGRYDVELRVGSRTVRVCDLLAADLLDLKRLRPFATDAGLVVPMLAKGQAPMWDAEVQRALDAADIVEQDAEDSEAMEIRALLVDLSESARPWEWSEDDPKPHGIVRVEYAANDERFVGWPRGPLLREVRASVGTVNRVALKRACKSLGWVAVDWRFRPDRKMHLRVWARRVREPGEEG